MIKWLSYPLRLWKTTGMGVIKWFNNKFCIAGFVGWTSVLAQDMAVISNLWIFFIVEFFLADPTLRCGLEILLIFL